jgi:hypothetical protein
MEPQIISSGLYRITNLVNGKCYIGITKTSPQKRFAAHLTSARRGANTALHRAIRKYGEESFKLEQMVICEAGQYLKDLEVKAIAAYGTRSPNGYNLTAGGDGVVDGGPEVAEKIRKGRALNPPILTESGKKAISEGGVRAWADPDRRAIRSANIKARLNDPVVHASRCDAIQRASSSEHGRAIKQEVSRRLWSMQEYRDKVNAAAVAGMRTPQAKVNRSEAAKAAWAKRKQA